MVLKARRSSGAITQANRNMPANSKPPTSKVLPLANPPTADGDHAPIRAAADIVAGCAVTGDSLLETSPDVFVSVGAGALAATGAATDDSTADVAVEGAAAFDSSGAPAGTC